MPLPVVTYSTRRNSRFALATPTVGMPRTHTCSGGSSMNRAVQPPARETTIRYPSSPAAGGTQAKGCHPRSACRLIARVVPTCGVVP